MANKNYLTGHRNAKLLQIKCPEQLIFSPLDKNDDRPQVFMQLMPLLKHTFALPLSSEHKKKRMQDGVTILQ